MKQNYRKLGEIVKLVDERNKSLVSTEVLGISIDKEFMPSVANTIGTDLSNYKLLKKNRFACNPMHVGRDERLPVSLYNGEIPAIVSPAYFMFEIADTKSVLPDYLMLNFKRADFDRNCWFRTDGSVRGGIAWDDLCELELPVPDLTEQQRIVKAYNTVDRRIRLLQQINEKLEATAQCLFDELYKNDFSLTSLSELIDVRDGTHDSPNYVETGFPLVTSQNLSAFSIDKINTNKITEEDFHKINERSLVEKNDILMSMIGTVGLVSLVTDKQIDFAIKNVALLKTSKSNDYRNYVLCFLKSKSFTT